MSGKIRRPFRLALLGAVLWALAWNSACGSKKPSGREPASGGAAEADESRVVLRVGSVSYPGSEFSRYVQVTTGGSLRDLDALASSELFDQFADDKILLSAAFQGGVTLSYEEKRAFLDEAEEGTWTEEEKATILASDSGPLVDKMRIEKYVREMSQGIAVGDDEVKAYYDGHPAEYSFLERVQVSQILVPTEAEAVELWEQARFADEEVFRALARAKSTGPEAAGGGEMGVFQKGQLPGDMEAAIFGMAEGEVSPVVESSYGYHIFRLDKRFAPEKVPFETAAPSIRKKLLELKTEASARRQLAELKRSVDWEIFPENLPFSYQRENT